MSDLALEKTLRPRLISLEVKPRIPSEQQAKLEETSLHFSTCPSQLPLASPDL